MDFVVQVGMYFISNTVAQSCQEELGKNGKSVEHEHGNKYVFSWKLDGSIFA